MKSCVIFPTILICLSALVSGCATLFPGNDVDGPDSSDITTTSQSAPERDPADLSSVDYHRNQVVHAIQNRDIVPGMSAHEVISAWGRPRDVEVAGDGSHGNERWVYYSGNSRRYGLGGARMIYFENGRVVGWESGR